MAQRETLLEIINDLTKLQKFQTIKSLLKELKTRVIDLDVILEDPSLERLLDQLYALGYKKSEVQPRKRRQIKQNVNSCSDDYDDDESE